MRYSAEGPNVLSDMLHVLISKKIVYFDVVSLYPIVNSLDDYAVGFLKYVNVQPDDILHDRFIGLVKCDVAPPKKI